MTGEEPDYYPYNFYRFARQIAAKHEVLQSMLDEHVADWGEILFTHYLSDVSRKFAELFLDPQGHQTAIEIMQVMEEAMAHDDPAIVNEVAVGFVEMLPCGNDAGTDEIRAALPPRLRDAWEDLCWPRATP